MGKAFDRELKGLRETLTWARATADATPLSRFVADARGLPLVAVGSGGSVTSCHLAALLHRARYQCPAFHTTPLDILVTPPGLHRSALLLASASGRNKDALGALSACIADEAPVVGTITLRARAPLTKAARLYSRAHVFEAELPCGKDGYLATNSLIATCALLTRAYGFEMPEVGDELHGDSGALFHERHMVQILFGGWAAPVATDLESKLNESALASAQLADYRNFGHGRHLWLSKRAAETVVIALITPEVSKLADATLRLLPKDVPIVHLRTANDGPVGTIELLFQAFHLVGQIGRERNADPGRPHVPEFGRRLYHLPPPRAALPKTPAVRHKLRSAPLDNQEIQSHYASALRQFLNKARTAQIGAIALDYDGTLCDQDARFSGLRQDIITECSRLLRSGIRLGIATGRGKSVREEFQRTINPSLWNRLFIGYYNGADIAPLSDTTVPNITATTDERLERARLLLEADAFLQVAATITVRPHQLTLEPKGSLRTESFAAHVMSRLASLDGSGVRVVCSTHSLDVLGPKGGKLEVVTKLRQIIGGNREVLCIGDRGSWPGNDYALLSQPFSLSVDQVSSLGDSCWNLAPVGLSGPDVTLLYLRAIKTRKAVGSFDWEDGEQQ